MFALGLMTSDPNLMACELERLAPAVDLSQLERVDAAGLGAFAPEETLLHRYPKSALPRSLTELAPKHPTAVLMFHARALPVGVSLEDGVQPLRFRRWLFALVGQLADYRQLKPHVTAALPGFLVRQMGCDHDGEAAFALFLSALRHSGRTDDRALPAAMGAKLLGQTVRTIRQLSTQAGIARAPSFAVLASNGEMTIAARCGDQPLFYTLLEGTEECRRCALPDTRGDGLNRMRAHGRRRAVAIAGTKHGPAGWLELPDGTALGVDATIGVHHVAF